MSVDSVAVRIFQFTLEVEDGIHAKHDPDVVAERLANYARASLSDAIVADEMMRETRGTVSDIEQVFPGDIVAGDDIPPQMLYIPWTEDREHTPGEIATGTPFRTLAEAEDDIFEIANRIYDDPTTGHCEDDRPTDYREAVDMLAHWYHIGAGVIEVEVPRW
jgi:hypothetical protein